MVHFVMMSTEHDFRPGSRQYQWLEKDLKSVDRSKTPWVIVGGHRAMYTSAIMPGLFLNTLCEVFVLQLLCNTYRSIMFVSSLVRFTVETWSPHIKIQKSEDTNFMLQLS